MKRLITYIIAIAATIYTAVLYGSTSFLMLFYVELILPVFMLLTLLPTVRRLSVRLLLPVSVAEQGQKSPVLLQFKNGGVFPSGRLAIQVSSRLPMDEKPERTWFFGYVGARRRGKDGAAQVKAEYRPTCVGSISMEITRVWCYDMLGLVALPLPARYWRALKPESLLVLPKLCEMPVTVSRQSRDFAGESEEYSKEKSGDDPSEIFGIRDYQPGDKLRSVHWRLSARTGDLIVREQSLPLGCPVIFFLNLYQPTVRRGKASIKRDSYLQIAASVSHSILQEGCRHYVIWFNQNREDIFRIRIEKEEDVYEMLFRLGGIVTYSQKRDLQELYRMKYHETPVVTSLELKIDLTLEKNGERLEKYYGSPEDVERQLGARELIV